MEPIQAHINHCHGHPELDRNGAPVMTVNVQRIGQVLHVDEQSSGRRVGLHLLFCCCHVAVQAVVSKLKMP